MIAAGKFLHATTAGMFPDTFPLMRTLPDGSSVLHPLSGGLPPEWGGLIICLIVLFYVFFGGLRGAVWANTLQTIVFMITGVIAFYLISTRLGGLAAASEMVANSDFASDRLAREGKMGQLQFFSYFLVPLSVGMFPHLFQHWLTAKSAKSFRLTVIAHPIFIMIVWVPCILIGIWAAGHLGPLGPGQSPNAVLGRMVGELVHSPVLSGLVAAGVLAAIMSSLDSQFVCLGTMFTTDVVLRIVGKDRFTESQVVMLGRGFIVAIVAITYALAMWLKDSAQVFDLGVWCFSGFAGLFPVVVAAVYWRRATTAGVIASILATAGSWCVLFYRDMVAEKPPGMEDELLIFGMMPVAILVAISAVTLVIGSLVTSPPAKEIVDRFFPTKA